MRVLPAPVWPLAEHLSFGQNWSSVFIGSPSFGFIDTAYWGYDCMQWERHLNSTTHKALFRMEFSSAWDEAASPAREEQEVLVAYAAMYPALCSPPGRIRKLRISASRVRLSATARINALVISGPIHCPAKSGQTPWVGSKIQTPPPSQRLTSQMTTAARLITSTKVNAAPKPRVTRQPRALDSLLARV